MVPGCPTASVAPAKQELQEIVFLLLLLHLEQLGM